MCGRYSLAAPDPDQLRKRFGISVGESAPRYNIAPTQKILAVTAEREAQELKWGLVPPFMKDASSGAKMINARAETVAEKPAYKSSIRRHRCLIPADGFYEWARRAEGPKQPFHITVADAELFAFAGIWATWHRGQPDELRSVTIITTAANAAMAPVHDRMPVILTPQQEERWLDPATPVEALGELMKGLPADRLTLRPVSAAVNNARYDGPDCLADAPGGQNSLF
ncbi:MAG: SOS response-associated peptidase [Solirubrobacterales bacterium]|nr:SOS response-associated peptidase [Solirubrobacterales bacterium]